MATRRTAVPLLLLVSCILHGQCVSAVNGGDSLNVNNYLTYGTQGSSSNASSSSIDFISSESVTGTLLEELLNKTDALEVKVWDSSQEIDEPTKISSISLVSENPSRNATTTVPKPVAFDHSPRPQTKEPTQSPQPSSPPPSPLPYPVVSAPLDALLDFALAAARYEIINNHSTEEPVPDFNQKFEVKVGPFKVKGHLDASQGQAGDLSSLYRAGPVSLTKEAGGILVLNAAVGLRTLRVRYNHYSARAGPIRVSGNLEAEASPAALSAQLELRSPCSLRLRALRVSALGPLRVRASGLGQLRRLLPLISRWMDKRLRGDVERAVVTHLSALVQERLRKFSCSTTGSR